jgi:hypothetical protein
MTITITPTPSTSPPINYLYYHSYGIPSTNSSCPFPYYSSSSTTTGKCDITIGTGKGLMMWKIITILCLLTSIISCLLLSFNLVSEMYVIQNTNGYKNKDNLIFLIFAIACSVMAIIANIDPYGYYGIVPFPVYGSFLFIEEGTALFLAALLCDRWAIVAHLTYNKHNNNPTLSSATTTTINSNKQSFLPLKLLALCCLTIFIGGPLLFYQGGTWYWIMNVVINGFTSCTCYCLVLFSATRIRIIHVYLLKQQQLHHQQQDELTNTATTQSKTTTTTSSSNQILKRLRLRFYLYIVITAACGTLCLYLAIFSLISQPQFVFTTVAINHILSSIASAFIAVGFCRLFRSSPGSTSKFLHYMKSKFNKKGTTATTTANINNNTNVQTRHQFKHKKLLHYQQQRNMLLSQYDPEGLVTVIDSEYPRSSIMNSNNPTHNNNNDDVISSVISPVLSGQQQQLQQQNANSNNNTISILKAKTLPINPHDVFIKNTRIHQFIEKMFTLVQISPQSQTKNILFSFIWASILTIFLTFIVIDNTDGHIQQLGYLFTILVMGGSIGITMTCMSQVILQQYLIPTTYFVGVLITVIINGILLGIALNDTRASIVPGIMAIQFVSFSTDALVYPQLRLILVFNSLFPTIVLVILVVFNIAPRLNNVILPIGSSGGGYSLLQTLRDGLIVQILQFIVELLFVWRRRDQKRFLHIGEKVERRMILLNDASNTGRKNHRHYQEREGNASSIFIQSGFFMKQVSGYGGSVYQPSTQQPSHREENQSPSVQHKRPTTTTTKIFVNKIAVKQHDCVALYCFPSNPQIFFWLNSPLAHGLNILISIGTCIIIGLNPFFYYDDLVVPGSTTNNNTIMCYLCLISILYVTVQELMICSVPLLKLLIQRVSFIPALLFSLLWMILSCYVLHDERCLFIIYAFVCHILGLLSDASVISTNNNSIMLGNSIHIWFIKKHIISKIAMLIISVYLIMDIFPNVDHAILVIGGGGGGGGSSSNNSNIAQDAEVIDFAQQTGDWGFFSLALPDLLKCLMEFIDYVNRYYHGSSKNIEYFTFINSPIAPKYNIGSVIVSVVDNNIGEQQQQHQAVVVDNNNNKDVNVEDTTNTSSLLSNDNILLVKSLALVMANHNFVVTPGITTITTAASTSTFGGGGGDGNTINNNNNGEDNNNNHIHDVNDIDIEIV